MAVGILTVLCAACSTALSSHSEPGSPTDSGTAGLRAAAAAWSNAFLTGTVVDIRSMEGAQCLSTISTNPTGMESYLTGMRTAMEQHLDAPLGSIRITGVQVRNVTATSGDAEVRYALPALATTTGFRMDTRTESGR
jgi:hypothetical protein